MTNGSRNSGSVGYYYVASEGIYYDHIPLKETYNRIACDNSKFMWWLQVSSSRWWWQ